VTRTIAQWRAAYPRLTPVQLAERLDSPQARDLVRAAFDLFKADPDNEAGYCAVADVYEAAEAAFLAAHSDTEVTL
jgi:hypothetical protein